MQMVAGATTATTTKKVTSSSTKQSTTTKASATTLKTTTKASTTKATTTAKTTNTSKSSTTSKPTTTKTTSTTTTKKATTTTTKPTTTTQKTTTTTSKPTTTTKGTTTSKPTTTSKTTSTTLKTSTKTTSSTSKATTTSKATSTTSKATSTTSKASSTTSTTTSTPKTSSSSTTSKTSTTSQATTTSKTTSQSTSSSTRSTSSPVPTLTQGAGNRGLSFNDPALTEPFSNSTEITWAYNWASDVYYPGGWTPDSFNTDLTYVPMLWSAADDLTSIWNTNVNNAIKSYGTDSLLAFNEPDGCCWSCGNSCMNVSSAVTAYKQWIQPFAGKVQLGSPAVTNGVGEGVGLSYLSYFMGNCTGCTVDFIPLHFYGSVLDPGAFQSYVESAWKLFGLPIWVTEFGTTSGTEAQVLSWLQVVIPWLDAQPYVKRYAYFMDNNHGAPYLLNSDNTKTSIGVYYGS
ncbi:glycoside hydrolase family 128 protein [Xylariaceae sp. FL1272]|nr:glycoside hydrolase family 128 protein [Xylariaceae sp. FL1272]